MEPPRIIANNLTLSSSEWLRGKVLTAKDAPDYLKQTALQICAMGNESKVLPIAREILKTSKHVPLKMSAKTQPIN
jgi:hypothetical protein